MVHYHNTLYNVLYGKPTFCWYSYEQTIDMLHGVHNVKHKITQVVLNRTWLKFPAFFSPTVATTTTIVVVIIIVISYYFCEELNYLSSHSLSDQKLKKILCVCHIFVLHTIKTLLPLLKLRSFKLSVTFIISLHRGRLHYRYCCLSVFLIKPHY
jgi:hypothetical protein